MDFYSLEKLVKTRSGYTVIVKKNHQHSYAYKILQLISIIQNTYVVLLVEDIFEEQFEMTLFTQRSHQSLIEACEHIEEFRKIILPSSKNIRVLGGNSVKNYKPQIKSLSPANISDFRLLNEHGVLRIGKVSNNNYCYCILR